MNDNEVINELYIESCNDIDSIEKTEYLPEDKRKDLMIGDCIRYKGYDYTLHISGIIGNEFLKTEESFGNGKVWKQESVMHIRDVDLIPVTEEILKKNGFSAPHYGWWVKSYGAFDISIYLGEYTQLEITNYCGRGTDCQEVNYGCSMDFTHIPFVNEIQHIFRLYKLYELSDNFKV